MRIIIATALTVCNLIVGSAFISMTSEEAALEGEPQNRLEVMTVVCSDAKAALDHHDVSISLREHYDAARREETAAFYDAMGM